MTTKVTIEANHGWAVDVEVIPAGNVTRVQPGATMSFYVYSGQDLRISEVQPDAERDVVGFSGESAPTAA